MSRDAIVSYALSLEGLSYGDTRDRYTALVCPLDSNHDARSVASREPSCGLTCEAVMRGSEVDGSVVHGGQMLDGLRVPYARRLAMGLPAVVFQETLARQRGLWVARPGPGQRPEPGCMVAVIGPTHVMTVTGCSGDELEVIEGGQIDPGNSGQCTAIRLHRKLVVERGGRLFITDAAHPGAGREVWGWLQAGDLPCLSSDRAAE